MARSRKSRKGKKEWRRNISTAEHDKFVEEKGREERSGGLLDAVPSENIFFVDKSKAAPKVRKVDKWRSRESHADAILKRSSLVPPLVPEPQRPASTPAKRAAKSAEKAPAEASLNAPPSKSGTEPAGEAAEAAAASAPAAPAPTPAGENGGDGGGGGGEGGKGPEEGEAGLGSKRGGDLAVVPSSSGGNADLSGVVAAAGASGAKKRWKKAKRTQKPLFDLWANEDLAGNPRSAVAKKAAAEKAAAKAVKNESGPAVEAPERKKRFKPGSEIAAVEVDVPGCSFNPSFEEHQDAIAVAVAEELKESYQAALAPIAPQLLVSREEEEEARLQEAKDFFLTEGGEGEGEEDEEEEEDGADDGTVVVTKRPRRVTRQDLNRRMRHRIVEAELEKRRRNKAMRKDLDRLKDLKREMEEEKQEQEKRRVRREIARLEFRMKRAPRLGRHKFKPEPMNVLTSDQVTGSLRQLKGSFTLVRDRFKSFQKRGIIETHGPTIKQSLSRKRRVVEQGSRGAKEREMHAEIMAMRAARQEAKKDAAKAAAAAGNLEL